MSAILEAVEAAGLAQSSCLKRLIFYDLYHYTPVLHASVVAEGHGMRLSWSIQVQSLLITK